VGESSKGTRGGERGVSKRRERANSASVVELWAEKEKKEEEGGKKRMRQKEEKHDEIFKRSKLVERSSSKREGKEYEIGNETKELIIILKELKNELKQEIAELRKEVRKNEGRIEDESGRPGEENGHDGK